MQFINRQNCNAITLPKKKHNANREIFLNWIFMKKSLNEIFSFFPNAFPRTHHTHTHMRAHPSVFSVSFHLKTTISDFLLVMAGGGRCLCVCEWLTGRWKRNNYICTRTHCKMYVYVYVWVCGNKRNIYVRLLFLLRCL